MKKVIWMFSGQGAQYFNMGRDLYEAEPVFRDWMDRCDAVVRAIRSESFLNLVYRPADRSHSPDFADLRHAHPALFSVQYSLAQTLLSRGMKPSLLLGYSLGEMVAAAVGGAIALETALQTIVEQAELFASSAQPGAMLAVLASPASWDPRSSLYANTWLAARNAPEHFVLAGPPAAIERVQEHLQSREILHCRLPVAVGFHSPLIDTLERPFREGIERLKMAKLHYPLVSAAYVAQMTQLPADFWWDVVRRPVRFQETIAWLEERGSSSYIDIGPSGTLAAFLKYGLDATSASSVCSIMSPFDQGGNTLRRMEHVIREVTRESGG
jgi:acyl transferase domain-containing protein